MNLPTTIKEATEQGYVGNDVNLSISIFEYGLAWKTDDKDDKDYKFLYSLDLKNFCWANVRKQVDPRKEWNWVKWESVASTCRCTVEELLALPLTRLVSELITYYGVDAILGTPYHTFTISDE